MTIYVCVLFMNVNWRLSTDFCIEMLPTKIDHDVDDMGFLIRREAEWPRRILVPTLTKKFPLSFKTKREIGFVYSISPCFSLLSFAQLELPQLASPAMQEIRKRNNI